MLKANKSAQQQIMQVISNAAENALNSMPIGTQQDHASRAK